MLKLEIYDCTLREGEQAGGVKFSLEDRIKIAKALSEFGVNFIELGWPIHKDVLEAFLKIKKENLKANIVAFGSTSISKNIKEDRNLNSIIKSKARYACIFGKTWLEHVEKQLKISKEENLEKIFQSIKFLKNNGIDVFYDAEHFFDGFKHNPEYALKTIEKAVEAGASRIILCDTNGGSLPEEIKEAIKKVIAFFKNKKLEIKLGIHMHNDCGLALTNSLEALDYVEQIQGTINGLGERVGNLDLCEFIPLLILKKNIKLNFKLEKLKSLSEIVYKAANLPKQIGQAFVSERAFSHKGGIHIDATTKGASYTHIMPEVLGLNHNFMLTSLGGSACVINAANQFGFSLDKRDEKIRTKINNVLEELKEMEIKGYDIGNILAEQYIIINKHFGNYKIFFKVKNWEITTKKNKSSCYLKLEINMEEVEIKKEIEGGPIDVLYKTLSELLSKKYECINKLKLVNYKVRIAKSKGVESSVRTRIDFSDGEEFSTVGVSENIIQSSLEALEKAFNYYLNLKEKDI